MEATCDLNMCLALEDPQRRSQKSDGMATGEDHQRVDESVRLDQGPIQVDTKRALCLDCHRRLHNLKFGHSEQFSRCLLIREGDRSEGREICASLAERFALADPIYQQDT